ncbi:hypothetical protein [Microbulbifer sp. TYP-18]|uniref:hypothetical protein n=1 Tax=Microbulbifer sp. TYP-18 TaxID=3230024 RepID=UPI0034C5F928
MKVVIGILLFVAILAGIYLLLVNVASTEYELSSIESIESIELHKKATTLVDSLDCPATGITEEFITRLQSENPDKLIARKGNDLLVDGFLFRCEKDEAGLSRFIEIKG